MPRASKSNNLGKVEVAEVPQPQAELPEVTASPVTKPKRVMSEKQMEALKRGQETRRANAKAKKDAVEKDAKEVHKAIETMQSNGDDSSVEGAITKPRNKKVREPPTIVAQKVKKVRTPKKPDPVPDRKRNIVYEEEESTDSEDYARSIDEMSSEDEVVYVAKRAAKRHAKKERAVSEVAEPKTVIKFI